MSISKPELTRQEKKVIELLAEGKTSKEIANILFISSPTATFHRNNLMKKLAARNCAHMVYNATKLDLL